MANEETNCAGEQGLCRDCLKPLANAVERCPNCGSPRLTSHPELHDLTIAHIDCDAFYAAIEKRDNPELAGVPVIVGGGSRGVVSTCCYMARIRGVRSAMPMFKALAACPEAVVVRPDMEKYSRTGRAIRLLMQELTPLVEPLSIDEAFLDLGGTRSLHKASPATVLAAFAKRIESEFGLTISIGLSYCKFLAKIASDLDKPRGLAVIGEAEAYDFLRRQPVSTFWGVGRATQRMLSHDGITDISTVQDMEESELAKRYGSIGLRISKLSLGIDDRMVTPGSEAKSVSNETTFDADKSSLDELVPILRRLSEKVSARLKDHHIAGQTITLKLKSANFKLRTRSRTLSNPTRLADRIFRNGRELLLRETDGTKFRLVGIGVSHLRSDETADPEDLIDEDATRRAKAELAIDDLRARFGNKAVELGYTFNTSRR